MATLDVGGFGSEMYDRGGNSHMQILDPKADCACWWVPRWPSLAIEPRYNLWDEIESINPASEDNSMHNQHDDAAFERMCKSLGCVA